MMNKMVYHFSPHAYHLVPALSIMLCGSSAVAEWTDELVDYTEESSKTLPKKLRKVFKDLSPWWSNSPYAILLLFLLSDFHFSYVSCILFNYLNLNAALLSGDECIALLKGLDDSTDRLNPFGRLPRRWHETLAYMPLRIKYAFILMKLYFLFALRNLHYYLMNACNNGCC